MIRTPVCGDCCTHDKTNLAGNATQNWCTSANMNIEMQNNAPGAVRVNAAVPAMLAAIHRESDIVAEPKVYTGTCVGSATDVQVEMATTLPKGAAADTTCMKNNSSGRCDYWRLRVTRKRAEDATNLVLRASICHELLHSFGERRYKDAGLQETNHPGDPASEWTRMRVPEIDQIGSLDAQVLNANF